MLEEVSIDESDKECRICFSNENQSDLIAPCMCDGFSKYVHRECLNKWRMTSENEDAKTTCFECNHTYQLEHKPIPMYNRYYLIVAIVFCFFTFFVIVIVGTFIREMIDCELYHDIHMIDDNNENYNTTIANNNTQYMSPLCRILDSNSVFLSLALLGYIYISYVTGIYTILYGIVCLVLFLVKHDRNTWYSSMMLLLTFIIVLINMDQYVPFILQTIFVAIGGVTVIYASQHIIRQCAYLLLKQSLVDMVVADLESKNNVRDV